MSGLLSGWSSLDPALVRLLRINLLALVVSTGALAVAYALGFRHGAVLVDLAVMLVATAMMLATPCTSTPSPSTRRTRILLR